MVLDKAGHEQKSGISELTDHGASLLLVYIFREVLLLFIKINHFEIRVIKF